MKKLQLRAKRRATRIRKNIRATADRPRLSVYRSNVYLYAQVIDDKTGVTLVAVTEKELGKDSKMTKIERAAALGKALAEKAKAQKVSEVVFDKGAYKYHGRVKAFADNAREGGLKF